MNGKVVEFYYLLRTEDGPTFLWKWEENQNKLFFSCIFWNSFKDFL